MKGSVAARTFAPLAAVSASGMRPVTTYDKIGVAVARGTRAQITEAGSQRASPTPGTTCPAIIPTPQRLGAKNFYTTGSTTSPS